jgi:hypothetical protein
MIPSVHCMPNKFKASTTNSTRWKTLSFKNTTKKKMQKQSETFSAQIHARSWLEKYFQALLLNIKRDNKDCDEVWGWGGKVCHTKRQRSFGWMIEDSTKLDNKSLRWKSCSQSKNDSCFVHKTAKCTFFPCRSRRINGSKSFPSSFSFLTHFWTFATRKKKKKEFYMLLQDVLSFFSGGEETIKWNRLVNSST